MLRVLLYAAFLFQLPLFADQAPDPNRDTVPVVELSKEDTAKALAASARLAQTEADWLSSHRAIMGKYACQGPHHYSQDFRILVGTQEPISYVELTQAEAAKARSQHEAMLQAQKEWSNLRSYIIDNYLRAGDSDGGRVSVGGVRLRRDRETLNNFRFTKDCRFIVPGF